MNPTAPQRRILKEDGTLDKPSSPAGSPAKVTGGVTPQGSPQHLGGVAPAESSKRPGRFGRLAKALRKLRKKPS